RLPWVLQPARGEPGNDVGDFLLRHWLSGHVSAPVGGTQFRPASDHNGAQFLIANECEKRIIGNGAALGAALARCAVTGCAIPPVSDFALLDVAGGFCRVSRGIRAV